MTDPDISKIIDGLLEQAYMDCPAHLEIHADESITYCGLPAEVVSYWVHGSSDHPVEHVKIRCPVGHWFAGSVDSLVIPGA